jgi:hypothetical protein
MTESSILSEELLGEAKVHELDGGAPIIGLTTE